MKTPVARVKTPIAKRLALIAKARKARAAEKEAETGARSKFDLGSRARELGVEHIPWGYNQDRITAMVVDPRRMYAYWEVRDEAIEEARGALGRGGRDAWLNLRVYDITGRIFDGTNAHRYFDVKVERSDRQWFLDIGRPTSCHCVEIGVKSSEGYFRKIARSGGVDFPRAEPGPPGPIEWLSVHAIAGEVGAPVPGAPRPAAQLPSTAPHRPAPPAHEHGPGAWAEGEYWIVNEPGALPGWAIISGWESHDFTNTEWIGGHGHLAWAEGGQRFEWVGPVVRTTWEAGPFPIPVEAPGLVEERYEGPVLVQKIGDRTRIVYGPWNVVIRGIGGRAEARVLARWEVRKSWITDTGFEVTGGILRWAAPRVAEGQARAPGASEGRLGGASERHWLAGSEVRLAGASEIFRVGASEIHYLGASETMFLAASETRYRGASERRWPAASETLARGASEQGFPGASERARGGASQQPHAGASERRPGAGSETRYPEASGKGPRPKGRRPAPRGRARAK